MVNFNPLISHIFPGILTQMSRDENTGHYGSFDRNWWHYKIRDFSSIILQQGGYFLETVASLNEFKTSSLQLHEFAKASLDFWTKRALLKGAFEEYYPYEDGYPPLAFSTLAVAKIILLQNREVSPYFRALKKASGKLQKRFESKAANQQLAGLAALAALNKISPNLVDPSVFEKLTLKTLALQNNEGWFYEYDGPDLGYLSVSLDCLWDLYDFTNDERFLTSAEKAFLFLSKLVLAVQGSIGMHNSRNTDYIVPYGITRFLTSENKSNHALAENIIRVLYSNPDHPEHFFNAVDDRYWCHYIGHSVVRAQIVLNNYKSDNIPSETIAADNCILNESGYILTQVRENTILISCRKGGILTAQKTDDYFNDFGWIIFAGKKQYVTHWWSPSTVFTASNDNAAISGNPVLYSENTSTPFKHFLLRIMSYLSGYKIIATLKDLLIFKKANTRYSFKRKISIKEGKIEIYDEIRGLKGNEQIKKAPRFSKRHVASADSFHKQDLSLIKGYTYSTETSVENGVFKALTVVDL